MEPTVTASIAQGLKVLLTVLRYRLLATPDIDAKIATCSTIYDCAHAWYAMVQSTGPGPNVHSREFLALLAAVPSNMNDRETLGSLIATLDGLTTTTRGRNPRSTVLVRRALEVTTDLLANGFNAPRHIYNAQHTNEPKLENAPPSELKWPLIAERPARAYDADLDPKLHNDQVLKSIHRKLLSIEIPAAEICAVIPLLYPGLPLDLDFDLALQTYDEGRHARQLLDALRRRGVKCTSPTADFRIWDNMRLGRSLTEAICIEQILGEGYSIGTDLCLAKMFEERGYNDLAEIHRSVHEDEFMHASQGIASFLTIAGEKPDQIVLSLKARFANDPPAEPWFREDIRVRAGFSKAQIARQRTLARPVEM